jgi:hypothetical protein
MGDPVPQMDQGGQQPADAYQPVPGTGSDRPPARPIGQTCVLARLSARAQFGDQLRQHLSGQSGHPAIGNRSGTTQTPRRTRPCSAPHSETSEPSR